MFYLVCTYYIKIAILAIPYEHTHIIWARGLHLLSRHP